MNKLTELFEFKKEDILSLFFIVFLIMKFHIPEPLADMVDTIPGKFAVVAIAIMLFAYTNPVLGVLGLFVAFDLIMRSRATTGIDALKQYAPSQEKMDSQFNAMNQFPYTLEQEVVKKMAPVPYTNSLMHPVSFTPLLNNLHDASPIA
jgi:hypothetical protein